MMKSRNSLSHSVLLTLFFVSLLWCIKSAELMFGWELDWLTLRPLQLEGLVGIATAPLLHGSLEHLFNNTLPLLLLLSFLWYGYPNSRGRVILTVWLGSGIGVWLFAREAMHLGASGLTHGIFFYLLVVSMLRRDKSSIAIMMIAFFMYGGMTMTIFPREPGISFEYHFFGALSGVVSALLWFKRDPKPVEPAYAWENQAEQEDELIGDAWRSEEDEPGDTLEEAKKREQGLPFR